MIIEFVFFVLVGGIGWAVGYAHGKGLRREQVLREEARSQKRMRAMQLRAQQALGDHPRVRSAEVAPTSSWRTSTQKEDKNP